MNCKHIQAELQLELVRPSFTNHIKEEAMALNKRMGELTMISINRITYYFLDFPFLADFAFFFAAIFSYIKNRSYLNFLKVGLKIVLKIVISYSFSKIATRHTFTRVLNLSASSFEPTIVP